MIHSIFIENYAIIKKVEVNFDESLNIITGETGAGKSIILGALGLVMGQRADSSVLYDSDEKCIIEATFKAYPKQVDEMLRELEYDVEEDLIIRREISANGKSRAFVNDTPAKLDILNGLSSLLIDLNSQFEVTAIQQSKLQLALIDALALNGDLLNEYQTNYKVFQKIVTELNAIEKKEIQELKEIDFIRFQYSELKDAGLDTNEQVELESELKLLEKSEVLEVLAKETSFLISDSEASIKERFDELYYKWQDYTELNTEIDNIIDKFQQLSSLIDEVYKSSESIASKLDYDPSRLSEIKDRLDILYSLQRKHQVRTVEELIEIEDNFKEKIEQFDGKSEKREKLKKQKEELYKLLKSKAVELSKRRLKVFPSLEKDINKKLEVLAMPSASIKVDQKTSEHLLSTGMDDIQILFKANLGASYLPIKKVASGGESSRLMLALKSTVADAMELPTMIFDEIDSGVSGDVAGKMGDMLKRLSNAHQLICITHSPQVAARAVQHLFVYKSDLKNRTITHVKSLDQNERVTEIAKMLSGNPPTTFALENAKELIQS